MKRILIVDDEREQIKSLSLALRVNGFISLEANNVQEALDMVLTGENRINLVVSDYAMPGSDGLTFLEQVKMACPCLPFVMVTADATAALRHQALDKGCDGFLEKPFTMDELMSVICKLLPETEPGKAAADSEPPPLPACAPVVSGSGQYLIFELENTLCGICISNVREIIGMVKITPLPETASFLKGVVNLRGRIIPVIDLRIKMDLAPAACTRHSCIIVLDMGSPGEKTLTGMIVDGVSRVTDIPDDDIAPPPVCGDLSGACCIMGIARVKESVTLILDVDHILSDGKTALLKRPNDMRNHINSNIQEGK